MNTKQSRSFEQDFKRFYQPLCLFALRYVTQVEEAEDIVQQVFADVWEKQQQGDRIEHTKAYLYQAVRNRSLNLVAYSPHLQATDTFPDIEDCSEEERIYQSERDARLWNAIEQLPTERKKIFLLAKRDGLKYQEIAEELHISIKTVENQMSKALKALRDTAVRIYTFFFG